MKLLFRIFLWMAVVATHVFAQVDVEHRRTLSVQTGVAVSDSEEPLGGFGFFWFNENHYPWTNTALRVLFAGVYLDAELSWFLPVHTNTAIGVGAGGGLFLDGITPYRDGERLSDLQFYGDTVNARIFINQTLPNPTPLPINLRATYGLTGSFYREASCTRDFVLPSDFLTQTVLAELRCGGIEPGLTAKRGAELYLAAETNYRSGFEPFGPDGALFPSHPQYQRLFGSLAGKIPLQGTILMLRVGGGMGEDLDELSAYKLGGNLIGVEPYTMTLHGYYTRELFAEDYGVASVTLSVPMGASDKLTGHLYGDYAVAKTLDVFTGRTDPWSSFFGVGAGLGFRAWWQTDVLLSYGYGFNAIRNGQHGGHEIGLALEKKY